MTLSDDECMSQVCVIACFHVFTMMNWQETHFSDQFLLVTCIYLKTYKIEVIQLITNLQKYKILLTTNLPV